MSIIAASSLSILPHWCVGVHTPWALPVVHTPPLHLVLRLHSLQDLPLSTGWLLPQFLPVTTSIFTWKWTHCTAATVFQQKLESRTVLGCTAQIQVRVPVVTAQVQQVMGKSSCYREVEKLLMQQNWWLNIIKTSRVLRTEVTRFTGLGVRSNAWTLEGIQSPPCTPGGNFSDQCYSSCLYSWLWFKEIYFRVGVWNLFFFGSCLLVLKS